MTPPQSVAGIGGRQEPEQVAVAADVEDGADEGLVAGHFQIAAARDEPDHARQGG